MSAWSEVVSRLRSLVSPKSERELRDEEASPEVHRSSVAEGRSTGTQYPGGIENLPQSDELIQFRLLVGIYQDRSFRAAHGFNPNRRPVASVSSRPAPNMGIYMTVYDKEVKERKSFKRFSLLINFCLGLQLIVAAALTALGAAGGSRSAVTVFGAVNTVIAGFLTFLKGSGLPNRLRYFASQWGHIREYIEQKEREILLGYQIDPYAEIEVIRNMYQNVRDDIESSVPDRFVSSGSLQNTQAQHPNQRLQVIPERMMSTMSSNLSQNINSVNEKASSASHGFLNKLKEVEAVGKEFLKQRQKEAESTVNEAKSVGTTLTGEVQTLRDRLQEKLREVEHLEAEMKKVAFNEKEEGIASEKPQE